MTELNQYLGGFLVAEGAASIAFSECKYPLWQLGRLARIAIGVYLYTLPPKQ